MSPVEVKSLIRNIKQKIRITKVVSTRSVKTGRGDFFAGFSAAWNSVQDDVSGPGADMDLSVETEEVVSSGMTLMEAKIAHYLISLQADTAAYESAFANGAISQSELVDAVSAVKNNYSRLIQTALVQNGNA
jgi:hypothetical protein